MDLPDTVVTAIVVDVLENDATSKYTHTQVPYKKTKQVNIYKLNTCQRCFFMVVDAKCGKTHDPLLASQCTESLTYVHPGVFEESVDKDSDNKAE